MCNVLIIYVWLFCSDDVCLLKFFIEIVINPYLKMALTFEHVWAVVDASL